MDDERVRELLDSTLTARINNASAQSISCRGPENTSVSRRTTAWPKLNAVPSSDTARRCIIALPGVRPKRHSMRVSPKVHHRPARPTKKSPAISKAPQVTESSSERSLKKLSSLLASSPDPNAVAKPTKIARNSRGIAQSMRNAKMRRTRGAVLSSRPAANALAASRGGPLWVESSSALSDPAKEGLLRSFHQRMGPCSQS